MKHLNGLMVDIETLGTRPGSAILSIGAVRFDVEKKTIYDEFYVNIDPQDCIIKGLTYDKDTLNWWKEQSKDAWKALAKDKRPVAEALQSFIEYVKKGGREKFWSWGAQFDPPLIETAIQKVLEQPAPWFYSNVMCARTVSNTFQVKIDRSKGTHHNALDDAKAQAQFIIDLFNS